jgi:putative addiction module component (TIGR02574 family)
VEDIYMIDYHKLSIDERIILIKEIEDSIDADLEAAENEPLPEWQKAELDRALEKHAKNPKAGIPWEKAMKKLFAAL